ncbi:MarR family winged helix-turn-helix transcriptional regulator [Nocardia sp. NPDC127526]|uniref:MarR family winged helix-turn-helix transcriptional regulator n=1 Tax=Nocardia sp. NPDC127526 TaxID=3345393 RepID=UPI00362E3F84
MTEKDPATAAIERAMVAIRRSQTRRSLSRLGAFGEGPAMDPTVFGVLDAVEARDGEATVTDIANTLGVDQPRASRLVARAVSDGLLERRADQADARRVLLHLTRKAQAALERAHSARQAVFARATADWTDSERDEFARLLTRFVADFQATVAAPED